MGDQPQGEAVIEHDGFTITSTTRSADELRTEMGQPDKKGQPATDATADDKTADASGPSPRETADASKQPADPQTAGGKAGEKDAAAPPSDADKAKDEGEDKLPPKGTPERRVAELKAQIATLTKEKHQIRGETAADRAEREALAAELTDLRKQKETLQAELAAGKKPAETKADEKEPAAAGRKAEPKEDDFEDFRDYVKAHGAWVREQARLDAEEVVARQREEATKGAEEAERKRQEEEFVASRRELARQHRERIAAYEAEHPEFEALMQQAGELPTNPFMDEHILHSEHGPALMRYFAENPKECKRIAALGPGPTLVELGKIEATKLTGPANTGSEPVERRSTTKAAPPFSPVRGSGEVDADDDEDLSKMEFGPEYVAKMNAREKALARRRL